MEVQVLSEIRRRAQKHHRCVDCGGRIVPGEVYHIQKNVCDGSAYTWKQHLDCRAMSNEAFAQGYVHDYWDGIPPLREDETVMEDLSAWRGRYPHAVCRIEFHRQISDLRWRDQLRAKGINPDDHE